MRGNIRIFLAAILFIHSSDLQVLANELTTQGCGSSVNCFYGTSCTSNVDCDYLIKFKYDAASKSVYFEIGGKHDWVSLGLRNSQTLTMDGNIGEVCAKNGSTASILSFSTSGKVPTFTPQVGLFNVTATVVNGNAVCRYNRNVTTPSGTSLRDLSSTWYLTAAYGPMSAGSPSKHARGGYATSSQRFNLTLLAEASSSNRSGLDIMLFSFCLIFMVSQIF